MAVTTTHTLVCPNCQDAHVAVAMSTKFEDLSKTVRVPFCAPCREVIPSYIAGADFKATDAMRYLSVA